MASIVSVRMDVKMDSLSIPVNDRPWSIRQPCLYRLLLSRRITQNSKEIVLHCICGNCACGRIGH